MKEIDLQMTLTDRARHLVRGIVDPIADVLVWLGFTPNTLTLIGFLMNVAVAIILSQGQMRLGGVAFFLASAFDGLDGALARELGQGSSFGAFLDSVADRLSEGMVLLGLLLWYLRSGSQQEIVLIYITLLSSLLISYARARAEGLGLECKVGLLTRLERVVLLVAGLVLLQVRTMLWVLAILTSVTVIQRAYHVWRITREDGGPK